MTRRLSHLQGTMTASPQLSSCHGVSEAAVAVLQTYANVIVTTGPSIQQRSEIRASKVMHRSGKPHLNVAFFGHALPQSYTGYERIKYHLKIPFLKIQTGYGKVYSRACILSPMWCQKMRKRCMLAAKTMLPQPQGTIAWQRVQAGWRDELKKGRHCLTSRNYYGSSKAPE
jgi:hypothetical protein